MRLFMWHFHQKVYVHSCCRILGRIDKVTDINIPLGLSSPADHVDLPSGCARFAHCGKKELFLGLAHCLPKTGKIIFRHAQSLPNLQALVRLWLFGAFFVKFQGAQHAQN